VAKGHRPRVAASRSATSTCAALPLRRSDATVAFYGAKVTPADVQEALFSVPELQELVTSFVLIVGEDAEANKTLRLAFELADGRQAPKEVEPLRRGQDGGRSA
jgi:phenylacetate-coenzyme A ligase PaaK-like adenylate-forming protein